jgi:site-specific recombinase XerD
VRWIRCKGNRKMTDQLPEKTTRVLYTYLQAVYGERMASLPQTAPVWISLSNKNHGQAIAHRTIQRICDKHLCTSKMHATRHTWAVAMNKRCATLTDIQKGLGHTSAHTTSIYMEQQLGYQNAYARDLEDKFGIDTQEE